MRNTPLKIKICTIILIFAVTAAIVSSIALYRAETEMKNEIESDNLMSTLYTSAKIPDSEAVGGAGADKTASESNYLTVDFEALRTQNSEICGWIYQPDTAISYPVAQATNNYKWLYRSFDDSDTTKSGTIFADYRCDIQKGNNLILYGHNMSGSSEVKFSSLPKYLASEEYAKKHPYFEFYDAETGEGMKYHVFAVIRASVSTQEAVDSYYRIVSDDEYAHYLNYLTNQSIWDMGVEVNAKAPMLLLSTCITGHADQRCLICCIAE